MFKLLIPTEKIQSVLDLTPEKLEQLGIRNLLLDVDCTLKSYRTQEVSPEIRQWLQQMKDSCIGLCLVSNGAEKRIARFAQSLQIPWVALALKPSIRGCVRALKENHFDPSETAMVGDQILSDVLAGNRTGIRTFLTVPIQPEEEPWFTRIKRFLEAIIRVVLYR
ncbi:MAG: YqeG family HAD IIIA-type phosphatase [Planctomycetia bacterium]|nr:YqeG family HAD IIIA-type phosphatase [Planctomycetia bacterium]